MSESEVAALRAEVERLAAEVERLAAALDWQKERFDYKFGRESGPNRDGEWFPGFRWDGLVN